MCFGVVAADRRLLVSFSVLMKIIEAPGGKSIYQLSAFRLIGMASSLDFLSLFEEESCTTYFVPAFPLPYSEYFDQEKIICHRKYPKGRSGSHQHFHLRIFLTRRKNPRKRRLSRFRWCITR